METHGVGVCGGKYAISPEEITCQTYGVGHFVRSAEIGVGCGAEMWLVKTTSTTSCAKTHGAGACLWSDLKGIKMSFT